MPPGKCPGALLSIGLLVVHAVHMLDEAEHLVAVAVLVVVPAHDLDEVVVQGDNTA